MVVVSYCRGRPRLVLVNRLEGLSLPRNSTTINWPARHDLIVDWAVKPQHKQNHLYKKIHFLFALPLLLVLYWRMFQQISQHLEKRRLEWLCHFFTPSFELNNAPSISLNHLSALSKYFPVTICCTLPRANTSDSNGNLGKPASP